MYQNNYEPSILTIIAFYRSNHTHSHRFAFAELITERIPRMREKIRQATFSDLKDFLALIRAKSKEQGHNAMKQVR
jgi:hypothetical protein